ncbi:MAG TPA: DUF2271 domain-containing protein, partial [Gemmatimonadaceae bacterium]|nr:DUF2271 domain-containing protein [Gemmatimonadaceae bacterium]
MNQSRYDAAMSRRTLLRRLAAAGAAYIGLAAFTSSGVAEGKSPKWDDAFELAVDFDIAQPNGGRYHRPYVAIWVEDPSGRAVRTLLLWVNTSGRGPRYIRELRRWSGAESAQAQDIISTISGATRLPGSYSVAWNGRDDTGRIVDQGTYRLFIEAAREHGTYQLMQQDLTLGTSPKAVELQ